MNSEELSSVTCGCGFRAAGVDLAALRLAYDNHSCARWSRSVFGGWGLAFLIITVVGIIQLATIVSQP